MTSRRLVFVLWLVCAASSSVFAQSSSYRVSIPEPDAQWMQVELALTDVPPVPLELRFSRSSPGRYAAHDFVRGVSDVEVRDAAGAQLHVDHPSNREWRVDRPTPTVIVRYRVRGSRVDGTYLGIDATHAHINMPASLMWARGFEDRPMTVRFEPPTSTDWRVATQLFPTADSWTFTAPNLQYLMDSPTELSAFTLRSFEVPDAGRTATIRLAVHHTGSDADVESLARDTERIVREARVVFGELPAFDGGSYTFIADYLPTVIPDGMEHRNSTVLTSRQTIRGGRAAALAGISHEFFHAWNVERIRPRSLEPFSFDEVSPSGELWLAEGFTEYYGSLVLARASLMSVAEFAAEVGGLLTEVLASPARRVRTLEEMSRLATLVDGAEVADTAGVRSGYLSYYTWGGAVALALDLTLRDRSNGQVSLDTLMRRLWQQYGKPGGRAPGYVDRPYTRDDVIGALAALAGDASFAREFFARYIQGREVPDIDRLLSRAGLVWRQGTQGDRILSPVEDGGRPLTDEERNVRASWLGSRAQ